MRSLLKSFFSLFSRVTSSGAFIPEIDGLRFIAIFWVLAFHINGEYIKVMGSHFPRQISESPFNRIVETWDFGVQLFFVISGFILSLPFVRHYWGGSPKPALGGYYLRRLTRIEPPYIINLILFICLIVVVKGPPVSQLLPHFLASLFYSHNLAFRSISTINFVTWSLEIEAQFYLAAPWLALLFFCRPPAFRWVWLSSAVLGSAIGAWWLNQTYPLIHLTLLGQLPYFLAGFLLAGWYDQFALLKNEKSVAWDIGGVAAWLLILAFLSRKNVLSALVLPFLVMAAYACVFKGRILRFVLTQPLITAIGGMCYTIYLYHPFLKSGLKHLLFPIRLSNLYWINATFQIFALGGAIVLVSSFCFLLFEKPFMFRDWPAHVGAYFKNSAPRVSRRPIALLPVGKTEEK